MIIFVAVDEAGGPAPVPRWSPQTDEDRAQEAYARRLMELRKGIEEEMEAARSHDDAAGR